MESLLSRHLVPASEPASAVDATGLQLPFDFARGAAPGNLAASHAFVMHGVSIAGIAPDALLCALFAVALSRYNGQELIPLLGTRLLASGQLLSRSLLHLRTSADVTLRALLAQVDAQLAVVAVASAGAAQCRAAISFIDSDLGGDAEVLALLGAAPPELRRADLHWVISGSGTKRQCALVYNALQFKAASVARWAGHLDVMLSHVRAAGPAPFDAPLLRLPLLSALESDWLAAMGTGRARALPDALAHESFEAHCAARPDATALRFRDQTLSYAQLNQRANQLAHCLRAQGIVVDDAVVVCVEPSVDIAIALLAIFKAGAVYVPLDPGYPSARIRAILDDTQPKLVLTQAHLLERLALDGTAHLALDSATALLERLPTTNPALPLQASQTASIYYTSGTTGQPKGVMASRANVRAYLQLACERYQIGAHDVMPAIARFSFSISMFELMAPLVSGATLVVLEREHVLDLERLADTLSEVTFFHAGPSLLKNLLAHLRETGPAPRRFAGVRHASSGGDMVPPELLEALKETFVNAEVFVIYGCSEISCMGCTYPAPRDVNVTRTFVGRPFDNVAVRVLDAALNPVPAGIAGEICFAGAGIVKGYLNRPELTAEKFVDIDGQRFYRTGDMGRFSDAGWLEILGRNDFQIKVRGMRIEIGEVEYHLRKAPGVRDALAMAKASPSGGQALVAYVVPADREAAGADPRALVAALRRHMAQHLPDYMLPGAYLVLAALPLSPNGKVDRLALPAPGARAFASQDFDAPQGAIEVLLARIWSEVLGIEGIGRHDDFFELGGHSLLATQVLSRVRRDLGVTLAVRAIFDNPILADLAADLAAQRDAATADQPPRGAAGAAPGSPDGVPADDMAVPQRLARRDGTLPTTFSQRRMWLAQQLNPSTAAYHIWLSLRLAGALDEAALRSAIEIVMLRHEAFRSHFEALGDTPMQRIAEPAALNFERFDLCDTPAAQREVQARRIVNTLTQQPFELSAPGLYRIALLQLGPQDHVLHWVMHHAIGDHWSFGVLLDELRQVYRARLDGNPSPLAAKPFDHVDYAAWQLAQGHTAAGATQLDHWRSRLQGLAPLPLPTDLPRHGALEGRGALVRAVLTQALLEKIAHFSRSAGTTPFMTLLACFQALLARVSGSTDIAVAVPVANRQNTHAESVVGTLINTLVLRSDLAGHPSFAQLLAMVKETALQAFANQDTPFEQLVECVDAPRDPLRAPLVQVMFNLVNAPFRLDGFAGLQCRPFEVDVGAAQFELALLVDLHSSRECQLTYSTELFSAAAAQGLLDAFMVLLESVLADPAVRICDINVLSSAMRRTLAHWNDSTQPVAAQRNLAELLGTAAQRFAQRPALQDTHATLTYAQLDAQSNRLARALRERGVGRGGLVGLAVGRGSAMVVAQLAILKSGAAYVPLDPAYPSERLALMACDARLKLLVTQSAHAPALDWPRAQSLWLDADAEQISVQADHALAPDELRDAGPNDPAYVIYTSGSTGKPKGVSVPHGAVLNFLASMAEQPGLCAHDRVLAVTTLSFDIAVLELLLPLSVGALVILASAEQNVDGRALRALLESRHATLMQATPSTWRMLIDAGWRGAPGFKALIGGEALPLDLAQALLERVDALWNMYGPTETTVWSTCWRVVHPEKGIRIGRPIANTQVHVLDTAGQPCLIGTPGEIYIGGAGVALGYLHRAELTDERFVRDIGNLQSRMYRTGDLGRWHHDGQLEHLGRLDHQVKIRGHRIELGEIEAQLATHPGVARNLAMVREDAPGDVRIVAYVVPRGSAPTPAELREHLRRALPQYMLPQHFMLLNELPLLPNGKLDRSQLPPPAQGSAEAPIPAARGTAQERAIAEVWKRLLGVASVAPSDNFFDLGGHSLLAMRAVGEIEQALGLRLSPRRLVFESLAQLAADVPGVAPARAQGERASHTQGKRWAARLRRLLPGK
ncbi:MAG: amino acid adenylation domain-containing protein [Burkholderiaceae bacterium]